MPLSQQARRILAAIEAGVNVLQVHYTPDLGEYSFGIAHPGGDILQPAPQRTVEMLRRHQYMTQRNEWPLGQGRIAVEYSITEAGRQALQD